MDGRRGCLPKVAKFFESLPAFRLERVVSVPFSVLAFGVIRSNAGWQNGQYRSRRERSGHERATIDCG